MARISVLTRAATKLSSRRVGAIWKRAASTDVPPHQPLLDQDKYGRVRLGLGLPQIKVLSLDDAKRIDPTAYAVEHHLLPFWSCRYLIDFMEVMQSAQAHGRRAASRVRTKIFFDVAAVPRGHWCSGFVAPRNQDLSALFSSQTTVAAFSHIEDAYIPKGWDASRTEPFSVLYPKPTLAETNRLLLHLSVIDITVHHMPLIRIWEARDQARPFVCPVYMPVIKIMTHKGYLVMDGATPVPAVNLVPTALGIEMPPYKTMSMLLVDPAHDKLEPDEPLKRFYLPDSAREPLGEIIAESMGREEFVPADWEDPNIFPSDPVADPNSLDLNNMPPMSHTFGSTELVMERILRGQELPWPSYLTVKVPTIDADLQARRMARIQAAASLPKTKPAPIPRATARPTTLTQQRSADFERRQKLARERQAHERKRAAEHLERLAGSGAGSSALRPAPGRLPLGAVPDPKNYYAKCNVNTNPKFLIREHSAAVDRHIHMRWREAFSLHHPDRGGDADVAARISEAFENIKTYDARLRYSIASGYVPEHDPTPAKAASEAPDPRGYYSTCTIVPTAQFFKAENESSVNASIRAQWHALSQRHRGRVAELAQLNSAYANIKNLIARLHYKKESGA